MAFTPRSFTEILTDMIAYVQSHTAISDFSPGSVVRTLLEAAALEDDEQYYQMVQLLDLFSISTASGDNLDRRLADYNISREQAKSAFGRVRFFNSNLVSDQFAEEAVSGSNVIKVFDSTGFPAEGFPYTIRLAERSTRVQDVSVIALDTLTNEFTLSGSTTLNADMEVGDRVSLVTGAQAHTINTGATVQAPPTNIEPAKIYESQEPAFIPAGNFYSNEILVRASSPGSIGNAGTNRVTQFVGSPPFTGAGVINLSAIEGGRRRERDTDFRARGIEKLQSLSRGTVLALKTASVGVTDDATGQRVVSSNILEDFEADEVIAYVDDGTGLDPDTAALPQSSLASSPSVGTRSLELNDAGGFPSAGFVLVGTSELLEYTSVSTNTLNLDSNISKSHSSGDIVRFVDVVTMSSDSGRRRFSMQNFPIVRFTDRIFTKGPGDSSWSELLRGSDFVLNKGTGDFIIQSTAGLSSGTSVVAHYTYYTNLIAEVQKVLEGSIEESVSYPGVKSAGILLSVETPTIRRISIRLSISAQSSYTEEDLVPLVRRSVESYISALKIGEDVILSRIIDAAHDVQGVRSVSVTFPSNNVAILNSERAVPFDSNGNSLVSVR